MPFYEQVSKVKPTADPYPPSGTGAKDKINVGEALGLVMIDYGNDAGGNYGEHSLSCSLFSGQLCADTRALR